MPRELSSGRRMASLSARHRGINTNPAITSDGAGGAIVTWHDTRSGGTTDIYAQRVNASGAIQWTADGVALCTARGNQDYVWITIDGAGGAIVDVGRPSQREL